MIGESRVKDHRLIVRGVLIAIIALFYIVVGLYSQRRQFDPDEFMHLHSAWSIHKGLIPYRDYFDHYTPLFRLFFAPFFYLFNVETKIQDAIGFLFFARKLEWLISGAVVLLTFWLGKLWRSVESGLVAALLLLTSEAYWNLALEVRPDPLSTVFGLLAVIFAVRAARVPDEPLIRRKRFFWSGLFLALGFLTIQKDVYEFPGFALGMCWYMWKPSGKGTRASRIADVAIQFTGFCIPMCLTAAYFALQHGLTQFIRYNFLFYLGGPHDSLYRPLMQFLYANPFLGIFSVAGLLISLSAVFQQKLPVRGDFIVAPAALSYIAGLFFIPTPYYQYYILFLPLVSVFASSFLFGTIDRFRELRERATSGQWMSLAAASSFAVLWILILICRNAGTERPLILVIGFWFSAFLGSILLVFWRVPAFAIVFFMAVTSAAPSFRLLNSYASPGINSEFDEMRYILANTSPQDTVMDGYRGSGIFRPHAYFFWFMPFNDRERIPMNDREKLLADLHSGSIVPKVILFDINLRNLTPGVTEFFEINYEPTGEGVIWKRKSPVFNGN